MTNLLHQLRQLYIQFNPALLDQLHQIYTQDVQFNDPLHAIYGLDKLRDYFANMMQGLDECRFEFHHSLEQPAQGEAVLFWTMHYRHRKLAGGRWLSLTGNSHIRFKDKVYYHRDYFDAGAMLYEHLPLLGGVIRHIKRRMEVQ